MSDIDKLLSDLFTSEENLSLSELFENRISELGITKSQAYDALGMDKKSIEPILQNDAKQVDTIKLIKIGDFLNLGIEKTIKIYLDQSTQAKVEELEKTKKAKFIFENFDLVGLKKLGFIKDIKNLDSIEDRIVKFFGLNDIYEYRDDSRGNVAFSKTKISHSEKIRAFWIRTAKGQFEAINNSNDYDRNHLVHLIKRIRPFSRNEKDGFFIVCKALYYAGVTVIFQSSIPNTAVRGATFVIKDKPCIVITDRGKRYGTIWFSLLHELFHVLYHLEDIKKRSFHLTGEPDLWLSNEEEADEFARSYFLPEQKLKFIRPNIRNHFIVQSYAKEWEIHPSIIYNFYCHDNKDAWKFFQKHDPGIDASIRKINAIPFDKETVKDTIHQIKINLELI
jgi:HTH-type transcriptional regulator/antitoxin HigA